MKVYRIEDASGLGPYNGIRFATDPVRKRMYAAHNNQKTPTFRPCPADDGITIDYAHDAIGCISLRSLKRWFKGFYSGLVKLGFFVVEIEVPDEWVKIGKQQVAFNRRYIQSKTDISPRKQKWHLGSTSLSSSSHPLPSSPTPPGTSKARTRQTCSAASV